MIKKFMIIILIIIILLPSFTYASYDNYIIDMSNNIIVDGYIKNTYHAVNKASGNYINEKDVSVALNELRFDFSDKVTIHIIDYTKSTGDSLGMAFPDNNIILFDFIPDATSKSVQTVVVHELGHLLYFSLSKESKLEYKKIRGIPEEWSDYSPTPYMNRPTELFAEDFRKLFGGKDASFYDHFNQTLENPRKVRGLRRFMRQFEKKEATE